MGIVWVYCGGGGRKMGVWLQRTISRIFGEPLYGMIDVESENG